MNKDFEPADSALFFKSQKTGDPRLGETAKPLRSLEGLTASTLLVGYPDDEGIRLNNGRLGAAQAPDRVRKFLYKTTLQHSQLPSGPLFDFGNIKISGSLMERHEKILLAAEQVLSQKNKWISIGGGHDFAYPDGVGFLKANRGSPLKPLIINIDAHLDVRPMDRGPSSGTPFFRILQEKDLPPFDLLQIGIQNQCNSPSHREWCHERGVTIISFEDIMMSGLHQSQYLMDRCVELFVRPRPTFLSIDIDGFASAYAMGCSQSWSTGFIPNQIFPFFNNLYNLMDVQALGIYEVSPPLDQDDRTVKLAAQLIHQFLEPLK